MSSPPSSSTTGPAPSAPVAQSTPAPAPAPAPAKEPKQAATTKASRGGSSSSRGGRGKKRGGAGDSTASTRPAASTTTNAQAGPSSRAGPAKSERGGAGGSTSTTGGGPPRPHPQPNPPPSTFPPPRHGPTKGGPPRRPINIIFRNPRTPASFDTDPDTRTTLSKELVKGGGDLHKELIKSWKASLPTSATAKARQNLLDTISYVVASYGPQFRLALFGSAAIGGDREESDMDLCIVDLNSPEGYTLSNGALKSTDQIYNPRNLANRLERAGLVGVEAIPWARTPIVKCADPVSGIEIDINCNDLGGVHNTGLILSYCLLAPYTLRPLIHAVKTWAKARKLNDPSGSTGPATFSSYSLNLLCITYLLSGPHSPSLHFAPRKPHVPKATPPPSVAASPLAVDPASIALPLSRPASPVAADEPEPTPSNPTSSSSPSNSPSLSNASLPTPTPTTSISAGDEAEDVTDPTPKPSSPQPSSPKPVSPPLELGPVLDLEPEPEREHVAHPAEDPTRTGPLLPSLQSPALLAALDVPESHIYIRGPSIRHRERRLSNSSANGTSTGLGSAGGNTTSSTPERIETTFATVDALGDEEVARWRERNARVDVGELLKGFFGWFGEMTGTVTPRTADGGPQQKGEQVPGGDWRWDRDVASLLHGGRMMRRDATEPKWPASEYVIQDPFIHSKNCSGAIIPPSPRPLMEFRRAYEILTTGGSFANDVCVDYIQTEPPVARRNNRLPRGKDAPHHPSNQTHPPQPLQPQHQQAPPSGPRPTPHGPTPNGGGPIGVKPWPSHTPSPAAPAPAPAPPATSTPAVAPAKKTKKEKAAEKEKKAAKLAAAKEVDPEAGMSSADKFFAARMRAAVAAKKPVAPPMPAPLPTKNPWEIPLPGSRPGTPRSTWLPDSRPASPT